MKTEAPDGTELSGLSVFDGNHVTLYMQGASTLSVAAVPTAAVVTACYCKKKMQTLVHHEKSCFVATAAWRFLIAPRLARCSIG